MNMVFDSADDEGLAFEVAQDSAEVAVEFFAQGLVAEERVAILGGKDEMNENLWQGIAA